MMQRAVSITLLVLAAAGAAGCATSDLMDDIEKPVFKTNVAIQATDAWRDENGTLVVCVNGWHARRWRVLGPAPFSFSIKPGSIEFPPAPGSPYSYYQVPEEQVGRACPERPGGAESVEVVRIEVEDGDEIDFPDSTDDAILAHTDLEREGPVLYSFDGVDKDRPATFFYLRGGPLQAGLQLTQFDLPVEDVGSHPALILLVPVAIVIDVLTPLACIADVFDGKSGTSNCKPY